MKRRSFMGALAVAPAAPALLAQPPAQPVPPLQPNAANAVPTLTFSSPDIAGDTVLKFFDARQFATLKRLSAMLEPTAVGTPGALDARAPEFLDFLVSESPRDKQHLYVTGLDGLEHQSQLKFRKSFAQTDDAQAAQLLAPLRQPWTYAAADAVTIFLREAKTSVRTATRNSEEWARSGRPATTGQFWKDVD